MSKTLRRGLLVIWVSTKYHSYSNFKYEVRLHFHVFWLPEALMYVSLSVTTELPLMSPCSHVTSCLHLRLTWPPHNNDSPIHTWLFHLLLAKPFDLSLTNPFSFHLLLSHYQYFLNVQWQMYLNVVSGRDPEMDGLIGVMVGWWAAWYRAGLPHTLVTYSQTAGGREWAWER